MNPGNKFKLPKPPIPPKPPKSPNPQTLSTLSSIPSTLTAILLGIDGPREIRRRDETTTLVTNLLLADEHNTGSRLALWGQSGLHATHFRALDIVQVTRVVRVPGWGGGRSGGSGGGNGERASVGEGELRLRAGGRVTRVCDSSNTLLTGSANARIAELLSLRTGRYNELQALAERGRLLAREWVPTHSSSGVTGNGVLGLPLGVHEIHVRVSCLRIRVARGVRKTGVHAVRALCRRVCETCDRRLGRGVGAQAEDAVKGVRCACGGATKWGYGWLLLGVRRTHADTHADTHAAAITSDRRDTTRASAGARGEVEFLVAEGAALGKLLLGADARRVVEDACVASACYTILETLVAENGVFRAVVRVGSGRPRLLDLLV